MNPSIPVHANDFKVNFPTDRGKDLNRHVADARFDFIRNTLTVNIRQSVEPDMLEDLLAVLRYNGPRVVMKDKSFHTVVRIEMIKPVLVRHTLDLDYMETGHAEHIVTWEYNNLSITNGQLPEPAPIDPNSGYLSPADAFAQALKEMNLSPKAPASEAGSQD